MVGATGLEPATPCTPFGNHHIHQIAVIMDLFVFQSLFLHTDFTHFAQNGKF
jgi:hypothetical protein